MNKIEIRPLQTVESLHPVEQLERAVWGANDLEVISTHTLHAMCHSGGQILGAFAGEKLVGFVVTIIGLQGDVETAVSNRLKLYSFIAGVHPDYQNLTIGYRLKLAQRKFALAQRISLITWTYDPLESRNARFNIGKLGCTCNTYHHDFHGEMEGINADIPTDRFEVKWWVDSERVQERVGGRRPLTRQHYLQNGAIILNPIIQNADELPIFTESIQSNDAKHV
ncbi:MAG: hypothetical protein GY943_28185, partial [Chloroflexi bacterium]|nr:hypothetical protein [Chloroflexota bacterium]